MFESSGFVRFHPVGKNKNAASVGPPSFALSHPCARKKAQGWGTGLFTGLLAGLMLTLVACLAGCKSAPRDPHTVVFLIESSPTSLDPRIGTDAQSEHIDEILFDGLVQRTANFQFTPALAASWDEPDPRTYIFHLRPGVVFHNGSPLTSRDVKWTIDSMRNGSLITARAASYSSIDSIDAADPLTVVFHLKNPDNFLLTNLSTGAVGIVPEGSGKEFWRHPVGTGHSAS